MNDTTYLVRTYNHGVTTEKAVTASAPQAAARKATGQAVHLDTPRVTAAGHLHEASFLPGTLPDHAVGSVSWAATENVRLVHYPHQARVAPFWADPDNWTDQNHPIAVYDPTHGKAGKQ